MQEKKKRSISIDEKLYQDIKSYCEINNLKVLDTIENMLREQFTIEKYGEIPQIFISEKNESDKPNITTKKITEVHTKKNEEPSLIKPTKRRLK